MITTDPDRIAPDRMAGVIARNVALRRHEQRLSFEQLARRAGVSKGVIVQLEQARSNPNIATLCRLASALGSSHAQSSSMSGPRVPASNRAVPPARGRSCTCSKAGWRSRSATSGSSSTPATE